MNLLITALVTFFWHTGGIDFTNTRFIKELYLASLIDKTWEIKLDGEILNSPCIANRTIYIGTKSGLVYSINESGKIVWQVNIGSELLSPVFYKNKSIFVAPTDGKLYVLSAKSGKIKKEIDLKLGKSVSAPIVYKGRLFIGTGYPYSGIKSIDLEFVKEWRIPTKQMVYSTFAIKGDTGYIGANDGYLYAIDINKGKIIWKFATNGFVYKSSPCLVDSFVIFATGGIDGSLYLLNRKTGNLIWRISLRELLIEYLTKTYGEPKNPEKYQLPIFPQAYRLVGLPVKKEYCPYIEISSPVSDGEKVFIACGHEREFLVAVDINTGKLLWLKELGKPSGLNTLPTPFITGDIIHIVTCDGKLYGLHTNNGAKIYSDDLKERVIASPALMGDKIIIGTESGKLIAIAGEEKYPEEKLVYKFFFECEPNPFRKFATFKFGVPGVKDGKKSFVELRIYNVAGQLVARPISRYYSPGVYTIQWKGKNLHGFTLPSGVYFARIKIGKESTTQKIVKIK